MKTEYRQKILVAYNRENSCRPDVDESEAVAGSIAEALEMEGYAAELFPVDAGLFASSRDLILRIRQLGPAAVFNLFEGFSRRPETEAGFAALLESEGIPHSGSRSGETALCLDKGECRKVLARGGVQIAPGVTLKNLEKFSSIAEIHLEYPLFIKPLKEDASAGIYADSLVETDKEFRPLAEKKLAEFPEGILVEEFLPGDEYAVGFAGNPPLTVGVSCLSFSGLPSGLPPFLDYGSKWDETAPSYFALMPRILDPGEKDAIRAEKTAREAAAALSLSGCFRVDMRERRGKLHVIDANPNPGLARDAGLARMAEANGMPYRKLIRLILETAIR